MRSVEYRIACDDSPLPGYVAQVCRKVRHDAYATFVSVLPHCIGDESDEEGCLTEKEVSVSTKLNVAFRLDPELQAVI